MTATASQQLHSLTPLERFKVVYADLTYDGIERLQQVYDDMIDFQDPIHHASNLAALLEYNRELYRDVIDCRFEYGDEIRLEDRGHVAWIMHLRHKKLRPSETAHVRGVSIMRYSEKITWQRDYFDLGELLYERVPLLGGAVRMIKGRLQ